MPCTISGGCRCGLAALAVFSIVCGSSFNVAKAALIAYEPFNYPVGDQLNGKSGGVGWTGAWGAQVTPAGPAIPANGGPIQAGSLAGPAGLITVGNHVRLTAETAAVQMQRNFPNIAGAAGTNTWVSFLAQRVGTPTDPNNPNGNLWPNNLYPRGVNVGLFDTQATAQGGTNFERIGIGNSTTGNAADANHYDEWSLIPQGGGANREGPVSHSPKWSELAWGVLRIEHVGDATVADNAWLWLNPNPLGGEPLTANAAVTILSGDANSRDLSNVDFLRPFIGAAQNTAGANNWRPAGQLLLDEVRIGTNWDDMRDTAGIPEPASCLLLVLGGLAVCARCNTR